MKFGVGQSVKRTEDSRLVVGQGQYTDDIRLANETYSAFHRSPHARAKIRSIDISQAKKAPGVLAGSVPQARDWRKKGFRCLCFGTDVSVFQSALSNALQALRIEG